MSDFFYSVIEGFYGRQWSWQARRDYADFLQCHGFEHYIYAPKGDVYLRSQWRQQHPRDHWQQLQLLSEHYHSKGQKWGLGLSPMGLADAYTEKDRRLLVDKVLQLNRLSPDVLCILFDDMRGDIDGLAQRQLAVVEDVLSVSQAGRHIVCPSYYSFDPVLEQVFGHMPEDYWSELGQGLDKQVGIFWTGNRVISASFQRDDLQAAVNALGRKPVIWDNYPVNDGRLTSRYLHLRPYSGRPAALGQWAGGHVVNPMNQAFLSQLVLQSLARVYRLQEDYQSEQALQAGLALLHNEPLAKQLMADIDLFQQQGLDALSEQDCDGKVHRYRRFQHVVADEVADWLEGGYEFDPGCLTG
jgi:hypothetical protein